MKPGECYPIGIEDLPKMFSICNDFIIFIIIIGNATNSNNEWSNPIKILTVIDRLPKNTTVQLFIHNTLYRLIFIMASSLA
jgi:hypothetical protein